MNRRTLLKGTSGLAVGMVLARSGRTSAQGTPAAQDFPPLTITIHDDSYDIPEGLTAGRYAVSIVNAGTSPSHSSMGRLPDGTTSDDVLAFMQSGSEDLPDWFLNAGYVGLPDWPLPGKTITGVIDLAAGNYFMFDPFSTRVAFVTVADGSSTAADPAADATVELTEMQFIVSDGGLASGPTRIKLSNIGTIAHEFQVLAVPDGTTTDEILALFALPDNATPPADDPLATALVDYQPAAAMSILGAGLTAWLDTDLEPGTYALLCMLPFPGGVPHAMEGMLDVVTIG